MINIEERVAKVKELTGGFGADFVFQCTGVPQAAADAYKYVRRGGGYCEMGFFVNAGECTMNPHFDLCNKEITLVGSWVYSANEYIETLGFLKKAKEPLTNKVNPLRQRPLLSKQENKLSSMKK